MAEEMDRPEGQPLDEQACWDRWDQCSEKHLRDLRTEAQQLLQQELRKGRVGAFLRDWASRSEPIRSGLSGVRWLATEAFRGIIEGLAFILFCLLLLWLMPEVRDNVRDFLSEEPVAQVDQVNSF